MQNSKEWKQYKQILVEGVHMHLSTASRTGETEGAIVLFAEDGLETIYFYTLSDSRKYSNLAENPRASVTIYNEKGYVQMDGAVAELKEKERIDNAEDLLREKRGKDSEYFRDERVVLFVFTPTWIRLRVGGGYPPKYVQLNK